MEQETLSWLRNKVRTERVWRVVAMIGSLLAGVLILYVSFWITYGVIWIIASSFFPLKREVIVLLASAFMVLVVIVGVRHNLADLDPLQRQVRIAKDMDITLTPYNRYGMSYNTNALKAGLFEVRSLAAVINYILCGGVKLIFSAVAQWRRFRRLAGIDETASAQVLGLLYTAGRRLSFAEILEKLPDINPVRVSYDLRCLEGVLFLSNDPPGLALHPTLKEELHTLANGKSDEFGWKETSRRPKIQNPRFEN